MSVCHAQEPGVTYLVDVIEQGGQQVAQAAYWDFGEWSDLWTECKVRKFLRGLTPWATPSHHHFDC
jgi:hypothetical protein